ncbi:DUF1501 domain-containing protein [Andreprevotia chitinilytica]|uniref:DUF1501 domain-containing protein n=1 Tax=Andreprevotia chitinilytica TaxID=396808 RepID=UPI000552D26C|nr:DUF1501 domain-containing protein [Andreprevotia chitinilytica]
MNRRSFLKGAGSVGLAATLGQFSLMRALAAGGSDYKAIVCVFLFGGNDGNNMIVPYDTTAYTNYAAIRGPLALAQNTLVPLTNPATVSAAQMGGVQQFALHPSLAPLQSIWNAGQLAVQFNVGTLVQPTTKAQLKTAGWPVPQNMYSHIDQQQQWQTATTLAAGVAGAGWGGLIADQVAAGTGTVPPLITLGGNNTFTLGKSTRPLAVPNSGSTFGLNYGNANLQTAMAALASQTDGSQLLAGEAQIANSALANSALINPIINNASSTVKSLFTGITGNIATQLQTVAMLIEARAQLGLSRQIYFVTQGGYDTHSAQLTTQGTLLAQLGQSLAAFNSAMNQLGVGSSVTTVTMSDFARTLKPNSTAGSDHAWGGHHLMMGGAVKGGQFYGTMPQLALAGADDATSEGRWIPTTAVDQYVATLANWFGVPPAALPAVVPNLANFTGAGWPANLGFLG